MKSLFLSGLILLLSNTGHAQGVVGNISSITSTNGYFITSTNASGDLAVSFVLTNLGGLEVAAANTAAKNATNNLGTMAYQAMQNYDRTNTSVVSLTITNWYNMPATSNRVTVTAGRITSVTRP